VNCCARQYQTVKRQRADFLHKVGRRLVQTYDVVYLEELQVSNLVRNRHLAKSIADASWGQFRSILTFKAACAGKRVFAVPAQYTSQDCSGYGERVPKSLSVRTHVCPACGLMMDRDENAARNIFWAGQALRGVVA
jgi:putative transposase